MRGIKLKGFSSYAPQRTREGRTRSEPATPPKSQKPQSGRMQERQSDMREPDDDRMQARDRRGGSHEAKPDAVDDRYERAIRAAVALGGRSHDNGGESAFAAGVEQDEISHSLRVARPPRYRPGRQDGAEASRPGRGSQIGKRLRSLEPEIVPAPRPERPHDDAAGPLMRFSLVIMFAAAVAYGVTELSSWKLGDGWIKGASDRVGNAASGLRAPPVEQAPPIDPVPPSRLVVGDQQAFINEPLPLTVVVEHPKQDEVLLLSGFAAGTRLSAGSSAGASTWRLSPDNLSGLYLYAPRDFVGVMNTAIDLIGADKRVLDSRAVQLKWIPKQINPAQPPAAAPAVAAAASVAPAPTPAVEAAATVLAVPGDKLGAAAPRPEEAEPVDPSEVEFLMRQGRQALTSGDIAAARVAFHRLADAGNAEAALALAETYDPFYLAQHNVIGLSGDRATAKELYERARKLGSTEADRMLVHH